MLTPASLSSPHGCGGALDRGAYVTSRFVKLFGNGLLSIDILVYRRAKYRRQDSCNMLLHDDVLLLVVRVMTDDEFRLSLRAGTLLQTMSTLF